MCLACQEEAFYRAYLDHMDKKAKEAAPPSLLRSSGAADHAEAPTGPREARPDDRLRAKADPPVCDEAKERAQVGSTRLAPSKRLISGKPEISVRETGDKQ